MNKTLIVSLVALAAVVLIGGIAYSQTRGLGTNDEDSSTSNMQGSSESIMTGDTENVSGSLLDLIKLGKNYSYSCTFDVTDDAGNRTQGKVYVADAGQKLNGDFQMTQSTGSAFTGNVIRDGEYQYVWTSQQTEGFKSPIPENDADFFGTKESSDDSLNLDNDVDFQCERWVIDSSKFVPPSTITFVDISQNIEEIEAATEGLKDIQCAACDQVPEGEARNQCLSTLGCN